MWQKLKIHFWTSSKNKKCPFESAASETRWHLGKAGKDAENVSKWNNGEKKRLYIYVYSIWTERSEGPSRHPCGTPRFWRLTTFLSNHVLSLARWRPSVCGWVKGCDVKYLAGKRCKTATESALGWMGNIRPNAGMSQCLAFHKFHAAQDLSTFALK